MIHLGLHQWVTMIVISETNRFLIHCAIWRSVSLILQALSVGSDSNGSGVVALLEIARLFSILYSNPKTRGRYNLLFGLTSGGPYNYNGTQKVLCSSCFTFLWWSYLPHVSLCCSYTILLLLFSNSSILALSSSTCLFVDTLNYRLFSTYQWFDVLVFLSFFCLCILQLSEH